MPCYDGTPVPTELEKRINKAAALLQLTYTFFDEPVTEHISNAAINSYCNDRSIEPLLCERMHDLQDNRPEDYKHLFDPDYRKGKIDHYTDVLRDQLASWWRSHLRIDGERVGKSSDVDLLRSAMVKLTAEEAAVLELLQYWKKVHDEK